MLGIIIQDWVLFKMIHEARMQYMLHYFWAVGCAIDAFLEDCYNVPVSSNQAYVNMEYVYESWCQPSN